MVTKGSFVSMNTNLYKKVVQYAKDLLAAAEKDNEKLFNRYYDELKSLCADNENEERKNHPVQWETLADFTEDVDEALGYYTKALHYAKLLEADDYIASINFSMGMLFKEKSDDKKALEHAIDAESSVKKIEDNELLREIIALLKTLR